MVGKTGKKPCQVKPFKINPFYLKNKHFNLICQVILTIKSIFALQKLDQKLDQKITSFHNNYNF